MPPVIARSESEAFRQYLAPLQRAIAAFAENTFLLRASMAWPTAWAIDT